MDKSAVIKIAEAYAKLVLQNLKPVEILSFLYTLLSEFFLVGNRKPVCLIPDLLDEE